MSSSKLLVVDDEVTVERLIRQRFRKEIQSGEYEFYFAFDGSEALDFLKQKADIDIVITDINMPKMDGLTLLNHIQELNPITKTIMISAYGDLDNIRASMNRGAFDFVTKPIDFDDLRRTMSKTIQFVEEIKAALKSSKENQLLKMYVNPSVIAYLSGLQGAEGGPSASGSGAGETLPDYGEDTLGETRTIAFEEGSRNGSLAFASPGIAGMDGDPGRRVEGTVCFIDVCGFTSISEYASPETITRLLNTYFDHIAESALEYEGAIDKFLGDAAMVVFTGEGHLERAADCCIAAREKIKILLARELEPGIKHPDISVGLNTGEMVSGSFGSNRIKRLDFTVIGDTVNTAARLESVSKPGNILVPENAYHLLKTAYQLKEIGEIHLRNKSQALRVYNLLGRLEDRT